MKTVSGLMLEPQDIQRLAAAFRRACIGVRDRDRREAIARALFNAYRLGIRDESLLVHYARTHGARLRNLKPALECARATV